jgi:hypothetical protein
MKRLGLALAPLGVGCANTHTPYQRWPTVYDFRRPVMGLNGAEVDISDKDWFACDLAADAQTTRMIDGLKRISDSTIYNPSAMYDPSPFGGMSQRRSDQPGHVG